MWEPCLVVSNLRPPDLRLACTHIEPISAIDVLTQINPIQQIRYIQIMPAVPPSIRPIVDVLTCLETVLNFSFLFPTYPSIVSQLAIKIIENPKMETNLKFRYAVSVEYL